MVRTGRAVLLDPNPRFTYIAYDETIRKRVKVNQDMVIKYGLSPIPTIFSRDLIQILTVMLLAIRLLLNISDCLRM